MKTSMGNMAMAVVMLCFLMTGVALAEKKHWFVVKDKSGVCRVIEAETIAGPFKTMEEAEKRMAKDCPKGAAKTTEQLRPRQGQDEPMRPQQQQPEERQQHLKQQQTPHEQEQTEKMKGKAQEKIGEAKSSGEKVKEKTKEHIPSDKKN
jgi:hypothetical protein